jgi:hypothetical protein
MSSNGGDATGQSLDTLLEDFIGALGGINSKPAKELLKWVQQQQMEADKRMASALEQAKQQVAGIVRKFREDQAQIRRPLKHQIMQVVNLQLRVKDLEARLAGNNVIPPRNPPSATQVCTQAEAEQWNTSMDDKTLGLWH